MLSRRALLRTAGTFGSSALVPGFGKGLFAPGNPLGSPIKPSAPADAVFTFVSSPDLFNADIADLSGLETWDGGANSVSDSVLASVDRCLSAIESHDPDAVFVAGDLVEGRWNLDQSGRALFGEVSQQSDPDSLLACELAIDRAGETYYGYYRDLFARHGLPLYAAIGDHELLDDRPGPVNRRWTPWGRSAAGVLDNRYHLVDHCKSVWADHFARVNGSPRFARRPEGSAAEYTAYAVDFADVLTLITVDVFTRKADGVHLGVFEGQLEWLGREVRRAKRKGHLVIVQGHVPALPSYRIMATGNLHLPEHHQAPLYRVMADLGVDFYFCGEVHDTTVRRREGGPIQISHGGNFRFAFAYLVGHVRADGRLRLDLYQMPLEVASVERDVWATDLTKSLPAYMQYGEPRFVGSLDYAQGKVLSRSQKLGAYDPYDDPWAFATHLTTRMVRLSDGTVNG